MAEELGRIEKPEAAQFRRGRKLFFVPLIYRGAEPPAEYLEKFERFWEQVAGQLADLEMKLGKVSRVYHELVPVAEKDGLAAIGEMNEASLKIVSRCREGGARLEAVEKPDRLAEFMDWGRCLMLGLQSPAVMTKVYEAYTAAGRQRDKDIAAAIDATLKDDEIGLLLMRETQKLQFPADIQVFYVAPPALDEIKRWLRERPAGEAEADK